MKHRMRLLTLSLSILLALIVPAAAHAQSGRPILTIRSYTVTPSPVKPGQEFTVEIEIYNNGSRAGENTMAVWSGGDFLPVGEAGHVLWQLHINHTVKVSQTMRAPASLAPGVHPLQVDLSANDYEGSHYDYPQTIPVEVAAPPPGAVSAPPRVVIEAAQTEPAVLAPGMPFTLTLRLANQGGRTATGLYAACAASELAVPVEGTDRAAVERIAAGQAATVTVPLVLSWNAAQGGRQRMAIDLRYGDSGGGAYQDQQTIGVEVDAGLAPSALLLVESYGTEPALPVPGEPFTLSLRLANAGTEAARRLSLAFGGPDGAELVPFLMSGAGHVAFLGDLAPGEGVEVVRRFTVDRAAAPQAYNMPLSLSYSDGRGRPAPVSLSLSLIVQARPAHSPQLVVTAYHTAPDFITAGDPLTLTLEVANVGSADAAGLLVALGGPDGAALEPFMPVGSGNVLFVGPLAAGEAIELAQALIVDGGAKAKAYNLPLALTYTGPDGAPVTQVQRISLIVRRQVALQVEVYSRPDAIVVGEPAQLSLEVVNVGAGAVDVVRLRATGVNVQIETEDMPFVGPLDPGGSAPLDLVLTPSRGGTLEMTVHVEYRDDLNQAQIWSRSLSLDVEEGGAPAGLPGAPVEPEPVQPSAWRTLLQAAKGLLGLGS